MHAIPFPRYSAINTKTKYSEVILQITSSLCPTSHQDATNTDKNNHILPSS